MAKCSACGRPAVYLDAASGRAYCARHFVEWFEGRVKGTIRRYRMFGEREHIAVAVSGGKDSMALLYFLWKMSKRNPGWRLTAVVVDEGIAGYREKTVENFLRVNERLGVPYKLVSFREAIGMTLDEMVARGRELGLPHNPCAYCGVFRRYLLNKAAREVGATVLATAHNADDMAQTFLMNLGKATLGRLARAGPVSGVASHPKFVRRVKPFAEVTEKETAVYALIHGLVGMEHLKCPYAETNVRFQVRGLLNRVEDAEPGFKRNLVKSMLAVVGLLAPGAGGEVSTCKICGEPSSGEVCRACQYRIELGLLRGYGLARPGGARQ